METGKEDFLLTLLLGAEDIVVDVREYRIPLLRLDKPFGVHRVLAHRGIYHIE